MKDWEEYTIIIPRLLFDYIDEDGIWWVHAAEIKEDGASSRVAQIYQQLLELSGCTNVKWEFK